MANRPTKEQAKEIASLQDRRYELEGDIQAARRKGDVEAEEKAVKEILAINDALVGDGGVTNEPGAEWALKPMPEENSQVGGPIRPEVASEAVAAEDAAKAASKK
jgi:hypothetical protein